MSYLGTLSAVLTALVLTGNSGNNEMSVTSQILLANVPLFIDYLLKIRNAYKQLQARKQLFAEIMKLEKEQNKDDDTEH